MTFLAFLERVRAFTRLFESSVAPPSPSLSSSSAAAAARRPFSRCSVESSCANEPENCRTRHRERQIIRLRRVPSFLLSSQFSISFLFCAAQRCFNSLSAAPPFLVLESIFGFQKRNNLRSSASNLKPRPRPGTGPARGCGVWRVAPSRRRPDRLKCKNSAGSLEKEHKFQGRLSFRFVGCNAI